jgi:hypothetical protein
MSVGLLVVRFQYGVYVVVHLSKYVSLFRVNVCCVVSFYACCQLIYIRHKASVIRLIGSDMRSPASSHFFRCV